MNRRSRRAVSLPRTARVFLVLLALFCLAGRGGAEDAFFPPQVLRDWRMVLESCLREAGEEPLWRPGSDLSLRAYRLVWLPSFSPPAIVRLDLAEDGAVLVAKEGDPNAGGPDAPLRPLPAVRVAPGQLPAFLGKLSDSGFWDRGKSTGVGGTDGETWMLEAVSGGYYQVVAWHNPDLEILRKDSSPGARDRACAYMAACGLLLEWSGVEAVSRFRRQTVEKLSVAIGVLEGALRSNPEGEVAAGLRRDIAQMTKERELLLEFLGEK